MIKHSKVVQIHQKQDPSVFARASTDITIDAFKNKIYIGSSFRDRAILRGLSFEEEKLLLPYLIGVSATDDAFGKASLEFWQDLERVVPPYDLDGKGGGLYLEVGFEYPNSEAAKKGQEEDMKETSRWFAEIENQITKGGKEPKPMVFTERLKYGTPINIEDYVLYRYCLLYSRVAKDIRLVYTSNKVQFYMIDAEAQERMEQNRMKVVNAAMATYLDVIKDDSKAKQVLLLMKNQLISISETTKRQYPCLNEIERQIAIKVISEKYPELFVAVATDEQLKAKAFIQIAINNGILRRIANTDTIMYGDETVIGRNMDEAVIFLRLDENARIRQEIKAKIDVQTNSPTA